MGTKTSGTPNYPVTHEHRYFFGKLVVISSLHTSQNSIFPTCQVKYAVVYSDFPFLLGTKQGGACAQGFVNQGATWQFYGLCILLHQLTFLFSLCVIPWIFLLWIVCGSDNFFFFPSSFVVQDHPDWASLYRTWPLFHMLHPRWLWEELCEEGAWSLSKPLMSIMGITRKSSHTCYLC